MVVDVLKALFMSLAIIGWIFFIMCAIIYTRWIRFVHRNPNAQDILTEIILRVIFVD